VPAAAPDPADAAARTRAGRSVRQISREVRAAVDSAGPVPQASASAAHGLGSRLMRLLTHGTDGGASGATPAARPDASASRTQSKAASLLPAAHADGQQLVKRQMVRTLDYVASVFSGHYAPLEWKNKKFGTDLKREYDKAKSQIQKSPHITTREFQRIVAAFVRSLKDYHVGIQFYSTEMASLPLDIVGAGGKHFIAHIDRKALPEETFPFQVGDQVVEFDGRPVQEAVSQLRQSKSANTFLTDTAVAEMLLTHRARQGGNHVPQGPVRLKIKTRTGEVRSAQLEWRYMEEMVPEDVPVRDGGNLFESLDPLKQDAPPADAGQTSAFAKAREALQRLIPLALHPFAALLSKMAGPETDNPFQIGARKSFVPELGEIQWEAPGRSPLHAYIYKTEDGKRVGYIRIPSYMQDAMVAELFGDIIAEFEQKTDALVLDQVNNGGGSLFFMYGILSRLTGRPLKVPKQRIMVGEAEAFQAAKTVKIDPLVRTDFDAMQVLGPSLDGYSVTMKLWRQFVSYARFVLAQLKAGRRLTELGDMLGVDQVEPHESQRYTKPIIVLTNALDFSAADFLPAILQDNKRAKTFGVRTAGAGGAVQMMQFPNQFGIAGISYTITLALRANGQPIENLGVKPDIGYRLTEKDIAEGFSGYKQALNKAVARMIKKAQSAAKKEKAAKRPMPAKTAGEAAAKKSPKTRANAKTSKKSAPRKKTRKTQPSV
ncbi:MAG: protease-like activity factor CPAF, partial [Elusimicrobiota bacterium]